MLSSKATRLNRCCAVIALVLTAMSCRREIDQRHESIYRARGFSESGIPRLRPEIVDARRELYGLAGTDIDNTIATTNEEGEFSTLTIAEDGSARRKTPIRGFPSYKQLGMENDSAHGLIWQILSGGICVLDLKTGTRRFLGITSAMDESVKSAIIADADKKTVLISVDKIGENDTRRYHLGYDFRSNRILHKGPLTSLHYYPFDENLLFQSFSGTGKSSRFTWGLADMRLRIIKGNELTRKLTALQLDIPPGHRALRSARGILAGTCAWGNRTRCYLVRWDRTFHTAITPLSIKSGGGRYIGDVIGVSPDGRWIATLEVGSFGSPSELVIFSVRDNASGGQLLPIRCGYTHPGNDGTFMNHATWGPCYVDYDKEYPTMLFVYRLRDGLNIGEESAVPQSH